jgi:type III secretory pathway lipoprotein EscJ
VAAIEPLLVTRNASGQVEGVKYDRVAVVLLNAVKEQQAQIARLGEEVRALRQQLAGQRAANERSSP